MHVPRQWEAIDLERCRGLLIIVGAANTGKSTFGDYLFGKLRKRWRCIAFIDGDPGQSRLGPPTTVTLRLCEDGAGFDRVIRRAFIGSVSPSGHMLQMLVGAHKLVQAARGQEADAIVYDISGLIDPSRGGVNLKLAKIDLLRPNRIFAIQRGQELEGLVGPLKTGEFAERVMR